MIRRFPLRRRSRKSVGWKTIRRDALRELWSQAVRTRDGWRCRKCGARKEFGATIQAAHILSAGAHPNLKHLVLNGISLCSKDHDWYDTHKGSDHDGEADNWIKGEIGIDVYLKLLVLAKTMRRPSKTGLRILLREELRSVKYLQERDE